MKGRRLMVAAVCAALATMAVAAEKTQLIDEKIPPAEGWWPVGFAFAPVRYFECPGPTYDVDGLRISLIAGHNHSVNGLDFATFGAWADDELNGLALAGIGTWCDSAAFGIHMATVINYAEATVCGWQLAMVNSAYGVRGMQMGLVNCASDGKGFQLGLWNLAESWRGFQMGLVNMAMNYSGIQLGFGNIIGESPLTACVFVNAWF